MPPNSTLDKAQAFHLQGRLDEAEKLYSAVLRRQPDSAQALEGLGVLAYQYGRVEEAAHLFAQGVVIRPDAAGFHANLGEALRILKRFDKAAGPIHRALELDPALADAWNTRGLLAHDQARYTDAEAAYCEAIRLRPASRRPTSIWAMPSANPAARATRRRHCAALRIEPDNPAALTNLGKVLIKMEDPDLLDEAESLCRRLGPRSRASLRRSIIWAISSGARALRQRPWRAYRRAATGIPVECCPVTT